MTLKSKVVTGQDDEGAEAISFGAVFSCDQCQALSMGLATMDYHDISNDPGAVPDLSGWIESEADITWLPTEGQWRNFEDVPEHIADAASEAYSCNSIKARRAAILLARAVIEATAKEKGILKGGMLTKIDEMKDGGFIRAHIADGAHEVRQLGNEMAHGDFVSPVTAEDADLILALMSEVLDEVFQSPARVEKAKAARLARSERATSSSSSN